MFVVKAGYSTVLFICSSYMKVIAKQLKKQQEDYIDENMKEKDDLKMEDDDDNNNNNSFSNVIFSKRNEEKNNNIKNNFLSNFFNTHISLLFTPLPLSFLLQVISLYLYTYVGTTADVMKQQPYIIFCLVQVMSSISSVLPLIF